MASSINAITTGAGGIITTGDTSGDLNIQSGGSTKIAVTSAGVAVTGLAKASLPTGSVLQVVNATFGTLVTTTSSTFADTGLTASITPTSATSKVLVLVNCSGCGKSSNTAGGFRLLRGASQIIYIDSTVGYTATTAVNDIGSVSTTYLDSPATTSSTTYKVQFATATSTGTIVMNDSWSATTSTITLMEIAA